MSCKIGTKKTLIIIFLVSLLIRLSFGIYFLNTTGTSKFSDDWEYIDFAKNILQKGIFSPYEASPVGPGFPLILAFVFMIFGESVLPVIVLNALVSSIICIMIFYIGREIFNEKVGMLASLWSIFYVLFIKYTPHILKENWLAFLFPLVIFLYLKETRREKISFFYVLLLAFVFNFLIHMDERFFSFFPVLLLGFVFLDLKSWKNGLLKSALFCLIVLVLMVPWLIRNYSVYNKIVILSERTTAITDRILGNRSESTFKTTDGRWFLSEEQINQAMDGHSIKRADGKNIDYDQLDAMKDGILPHPFSTWELYWSSFQILWKPIDINRGYSTTGYRYDGKWSLKHNLSVGLTYGLLIPFFLSGLIFLFRYQRKIAVFLISIFVYYTLIHMLFIPFTRNRYRIPLDAFIIVIAFYGLHKLFLILKNRINKT